MLLKLFVRPPWWCFTIVYLCTVQISTQYHVQLNNQELIVTTVTRALLNLETRLEARFTGLLEDKLPELIEAKLAEILENKFSDHEAKLSKVFENKLSDHDAKMSELIENKLADLLEAKLSDMHHKQGQVDETLKGVKGEMESLGLASGLIRTSLENGKLVQEQTISELKDMRHAIAEDFQSLKVKVTLIENHFSDTFNDTSSKLSADEEKMIQKSTYKLLQNVKKDTESMKDPIDLIKNKVKYLEDQLEDFETFQSDTSELLKMVGINSGCPVGTFMPKGSSQCFKFFKDERRTWYQAKTKCEEEGLTIAKVPDEVAVTLRNDLLDIYGDGDVWVGARGDGSHFVWQSDGTALLNDNSLWRPGLPGHRVTSRHCLELMVRESDLSSFPEEPYDSDPCTRSQYTLCEVQ